MRIATVVILIALLSTLNHAQDVSIEKNFERERGRLSLVRFAVGEDATSGFDYLVYKRRSQVKKIRSVWNGGCCNDPTVEDFFFKDGSPVLYMKLSAQKAQLGKIVRGRTTALHPVEKLYLSESKLTMWIENGKTIPSSDPRWKDKEKRVLEQFKEQLDTYQEYQEGKL